MNENFRNNYNDEMEINFVDLMFYLLKQWKSLLVIVAIGLLLGGGIWKLKNVLSDTGAAASEPLKEESAASMDQSGLRPGIITTMDLAYRYRLLYEGQVHYNLNSILMQLDPNNVCTGTLKYYISAGDDTEIISLLYQNMISKEDFIYKVKEGMAIDCEAYYVRELLGCILSGNGTPPINTEGIENMPQGIEVTYSIVYSNAEMCEKILGIIRDECEALRKECQERYGEYVQETVFEGVQSEANDSLREMQSNNSNAADEWLTKLVKQEANFTEEERTYYDVVYLGASSNVGETGNEQRSAMKWLLIGILFVIVCWGIYYLVKYLLDKRVKYADELPNYYGIHLIGRYKAEGRKTKGIDKLQERMVNRNTGSCSSKEYIASAINMLDEKSLLLIGDKKDQDVEALMLELGGKCQKAECGDLMQNNSETLEKAKERAGIVLCVSKGRSTHTEIQRELEICSLQNISVVGAVMIE